MLMEASSVTAPGRRRKPSRWLWQGLLSALLIWILVDLFVPRQHSIRQFDPAEVARLETAMWRSYYEQNPVGLFWQLAGGLRQQFQAPFWRSFGLAYQATKAAFVFKQGHSWAEYRRAIPTLTSYYEAIQNLTVERFNVSSVAKLELTWWVVHRQRNRYSYADLASALGQTAAALYNQPVAPFGVYGRLRANAMRRCDLAGSQPGGATEADWQRIEKELTLAWRNLHQAVSPGQSESLPAQP